MPRIFKGSESTLRLLIHTCNQEGKISDLKIALYTNDPSMAVEFTDRYTIEGNIVSLTVPNYAFGTMEDGVINYVAQGMIDDDTFLTERQSNYFLKTPANYTPTPMPEEVVLGGLTTTIVENGVFEYTPTDVDAWNKATIEVNVPDTNGSFDEGYDKGKNDGYDSGYQDGYNQGQADCPEGGTCNLEDKWVYPSMGDRDDNGLIVVEEGEEYDGLSRVVIDPLKIYNEGVTAGKAEGGEISCNLIKETFSIKGDYEQFTASEYGADGFESVAIDAYEYGKQKFEEGYEEGINQGSTVTTYPTIKDIYNTEDVTTEVNFKGTVAVCLQNGNANYMVVTDHTGAIYVTATQPYDVGDECFLAGVVRKTTSTNMRYMSNPIIEVLSKGNYVVMPTDAVELTNTYDLYTPNEYGNAEMKYLYYQGEIKSINSTNGNITISTPEYVSAKGQITLRGTKEEWRNNLVVGDYVRIYMFTANSDGYFIPTDIIKLTEGGDCNIQESKWVRPSMADRKENGDIYIYPDEGYDAVGYIDLDPSDIYNEGVEEGRNQGGNIQEYKWVRPSMAEAKEDGDIYIYPDEGFVAVGYVDLDPSGIYNEGYNEGVEEGRNQGGGSGDCNLINPIIFSETEGNTINAESVEITTFAYEGNQHYNVWALNMADYDEFKIQIRFQPSNGGNEEPVNIFGCEDTDWDNTTFGARIYQGQIYFRMSGEDVLYPYSDYAWYDVEMGYNSSKRWIIVNGETLLDTDHASFNKPSQNFMIGAINSGGNAFRPFYGKIATTYIEANGSQVWLLPKEEGYMDVYWNSKDHPWVQISGENNARFEREYISGDGMKSITWLGRKASCPSAQEQVNEYYYCPLILGDSGFGEAAKSWNTDMVTFNNYDGNIIDDKLYVPTFGNKNEFRTKEKVKFVQSLPSDTNSLGTIEFGDGVEYFVTNEGKQFTHLTDLTIGPDMNTVNFGPSTFPTLRRIWCFSETDNIDVYFSMGSSFYDTGTLYLKNHSQETEWRNSLPSGWTIVLL